MTDKFNVNNLAFFVRGIINPLLFSMRFKSPVDISKSILLFGSYRGGTTWIGDMLSSIPGSGVIYEPTHVKNFPAAKQAGITNRIYIDRDAGWEDGIKFFDSLFKTEIYNSWTLSEVNPFSALSVETWIFKIIGSSTLAPWILNNFDLRKPVMIIRHPAAIYASRMSRGWTHMGKNKLADKAFFTANPRYWHIYERVETPVEVFAMRWCIDQLYLLSLGDRIHRVSFEKLQTEGPETLAPLFNSWNLPIPAKIEQAFDRPSSKVSRSFNTDRSKILSKWKTQLAPDVIEQIMSIVRDFELNFYHQDEQPDYHQLDRIIPKLGEQKYA